MNTRTGSLINKLKLEEREREILHLRMQNSITTSSGDRQKNMTASNQQSLLLAGELL